ncbi:T9SS C-terminal target domain-containing protein [Flavobacterium tegetincola]|uniref:T9SS C-terminal target domain-containing protein n=1 Tax=Flavobacterium tegetincola TaxID=150172 RepID=UPI0003F56E79|nr:T9SS C-terminal target domain-containing protein [Flavobacterium tegetincola]
MQKTTQSKVSSKCFFLFFLLFSLLAQAKLSDFSLSVSKTNETCESNGSLTFSVQNTTLGAAITYSIYLLPNVVNPINVTTQGGYSGLNSGTYLVVATQNFSGQSNSQQQTVTILDQVVPLEYQLEGENAVCINNGTISVIVTQGQAINYEIIAGPIVKPLQISNVFTELSAGVYLIRVFDTCGNGVVQTYTLFESPSSISISPINTVTVVDCEHAIINQTLTAGTGVIFYPLTINYTITLPNGQTEVISQTLSSGNDNFIAINQTIPITIGETVSYSLTILDGCSNTFNGSGMLSVPVSVPNLFTIANGCGINNYKVQNAAAVVVIAAPATFPNALPFNVATSGNNEYPLTNYLPGQYELQVTSLCGVVSTLTFTVDAATVSAPFVAVRLGCENGMGSLKILSSVNIASAELLQAPTAAGFSLPMDVSDLLFGSPLALNMSNLPAGFYSFSVVNECGTTYNLSATIESYQEVKTVNVIENCGSFDLFLNHLTTPFVAMTYHLQKYFAIGNYWGHPITGLIDGTLILANNATQFNIASSGSFRIIGKNFIYGNGGPSVNCVLPIGEFNFYSVPKINSVYSFSCDANGLDVFVDAEGINDLTYKIIAKNGLPFFIDNVTNPLFTSLAVGTYTFQVQDGCNNILIGDFEVGGNQIFPISVENACPQQNASLSVTNLPYLNYQWWKGTDSTNILSTTNVLNVPNFNPTTDSGMYHVRVYYAGATNSCIDVQMDYLIDNADYLLNAGENTITQFCGNQESIDLFELLEGDPNLEGTWTDLSNTGLLTDSIWNAASVASGIYTFKYSVSGLCNAEVSVLLQITITAIPEDISIVVNSLICNGETIELTTALIPDAAYFWQGPNGFTSTDQNTVIENATTVNAGTYYLRIKLGSCESEPVSFNVELTSFPDFIISASCVSDNSDYELFAQPADTTLNSEDFNYSWSSPTGNLGSTNPISILGRQSGIYTVIITDIEGCFITVSQEVKGTVCKIPKGISPNGDGDNDSFDLSGFNVKKLIVYSRYGRIVYEKENYTNQWHGQDFKDRNLPAATYYYYIETASGEELVGWVFVIRS